MDIVKQVKKVEEFKAELGQVVEAISDDVLVYFNNPTITLEEKSKTIAQFCKQGELSPEMTNFLAFMVDGRYMNELEGVQVAFERIYGEDTSTKV